MSKGVIIFIEGDTETEFYSRITSQLHSFAPEQRFKVDKLFIRNLKGIGNYKSRAKRVFVNDIISKHPDMNFTVVFCYDTDVFDLSAHPPVVWTEVEQELKECGANKVIQIKARRSIEDWFLLDKHGILRFLRLPETSNIPRGSGAETIKALFKKAGKIYIKGSAAKGFVDALNVKHIMACICPELKKLCKELGIKCASSKCREH